MFARKCARPKRVWHNFVKGNKFPIPLDFKINEDKISSWPQFKGYWINNRIEIRDEPSMNHIYDNGYFGKGSLSKSAPTYKERLEQFKSGKQNSSEKVTKKCQQASSSREEDTAEEDVNTDDENEVLTEEPSMKDVKEVLYLSHQEAFFLSYCLVCLKVFDENKKELEMEELWRLFCELDATFPYKYYVYHHFRTKTKNVWVVRSGIQFGGDYVLYKESPDLYHSSYVVLVSPCSFEKINDNSEFTWPELIAVQRVAATAAKELVIALVLYPENTNLSTSACLKTFQVKEVLMRGWTPKTNNLITFGTQS